MRLFVTAFSWDWREQLSSEPLDCVDESLIGDHAAMDRAYCEPAARELNRQGHKHVHVLITTDRAPTAEEARRAYEAQGPHSERWLASR